jgi:hypothetical protein
MNNLDYICLRQFPLSAPSPIVLLQTPQNSLYLTTKDELEKPHGIMYQIATSFAETTTTGTNSAGGSSKNKPKKSTGGTADTPYG